MLDEIHTWNIVHNKMILTGKSSSSDFVEKVASPGLSLSVHLVSVPG